MCNRKIAMPIKNEDLLIKVRKQIAKMDQAAKEASTWSAAFWDQETYDLLKRIEKDLIGKD